MSSKRKSDTNNTKGKKKSKKQLSDEEDFNDEEDPVSDASNKEEEEEEVDQNEEPAQEFLPNSEAAKNLKEKTAGNVGVLLIAGGVNWDMVGRKQPLKGEKNVSTRPINLWVPTRLLPERRVRQVVSFCSAAHSVLIMEMGEVMTFGRNDKGQLGLGDTKTRDQPEVIEELQNYHIVDAAVGKAHSLFLTERGTVFACGDNKSGQLGLGKNTGDLAQVEKPRLIKYKGSPIVKVGCGGEFSMILDVQGGLHSFGLPEHGQLGHNTDGQFFVNSTKLSFQFVLAPKKIVMFIEKSKDGHASPVQVDEIMDFACGQNHTVAIDGRKRLFTWGFGGYGRLGHAEPKNEMVPRLVKFFDVQNRGVKAVACGAAFTIAINDIGAVYLWGQTKRTGEANMYPKPVQDLSGWNVRSIGCGQTSIVVAADESVIAWGPSPVYGELGLGDMKKSSTTPMEVKALDGIHINQVTCGFGHTLYIARDTSDEEKEKIKQLDEHQP